MVYGCPICRSLRPQKFPAQVLQHISAKHPEADPKSIRITALIGAGQRGVDSDKEHATESESDSDSPSSTQSRHGLIVGRDVDERLLTPENSDASSISDSIMHESEIAPLSFPDSAACKVPKIWYGSVSRNIRESNDCTSLKVGSKVQWFDCSSLSWKEKFWRY